MIMNPLVKRQAAATVLVVMALLGGPGTTKSAESESEDWPSFRGPNASGVQAVEGPLEWDATTGDGIAWKCPVPGLGLSSPVVWGDRIFLTTAVPDSGDPELRVGLYGDVTPSEDAGPQSFRVLCIDRTNGDVLWSKEVHRGTPKVKRHPKSSHANPTVATDGTHVVAFFGSEGLHCLDFSGKVLWTRSLGVLDSGFFRMKEAQWGFASSPIILDGRIIVQCDVQEGSFIGAFDAGTGEPIWRTERDEVPTWSTPTIYEVEGRRRIAVNGFRHIGGYDFETGEEVWRLTGGGDIPVPTPVAAHGLLFITNAHGGLAPVYAIRQDAVGTLDPRADGAGQNKEEGEGEDGGKGGIAWWKDRGGNYMQTPIVVGDHLFACSDAGVLTCFEAATGTVAFRERLRTGDSGFGFTASPVSDGERLYFATEDGHVVIVAADPEFRILARNPMGESCMATPALAEGTLLVRGRHHLFAIRKNPEE